MFHHVIVSGGVSGLPLTMIILPLFISKKTRVRVRLPRNTLHIHLLELGLGLETLAENIIEIVMTILLRECDSSRSYDHSS